MHHKQIPLVDGMPNIMQWYEAEHVIGHKRQECAKTIRKMARCDDLPNLFEDQQLLYANAQRLSKAATLEPTVAVSTKTIRAEPCDDACLVSEEPVAQQSSKAATLEPIVAVSTKTIKAEPSDMAEEPAEQAEKKLKIEMEVQKPSTSHATTTATRRVTHPSKLNVKVNKAAFSHYKKTKAAQKKNLKTRQYKTYYYCDEAPDRLGHPCMYRTTDFQQMKKHRRRHHEVCQKGWKKCLLGCGLSVHYNYVLHHLRTCHGVKGIKTDKLEQNKGELTCTYEHDRLPPN